MISLSAYQDDNIRGFNTLTSRLNNSPIFINEDKLAESYTNELNSISYKMKLYENRTINFAHNKEYMLIESIEDEEFTLNEQFAIRDTFLYLGYTAIMEMLKENNIPIEIDEGKIDVKGFLKNAGNAINNVASKAKDGLKEIGKKFKGLKEFLEQVMKSAIKTAKELINKFLDLMENLKIGFQKLLSFFGDNGEDFEDELAGKLENAVNNKGDRPEDNIYEAFSLFKKKKQKEEEDTSDKEDVYVKSRDAKPGDKKVGWKGILLKILKSIAISVTVLILVPALLGCIFGPAVAMIAATVAKGVMISYAVWKWFKNVRDTVSNPEWKQKSKWKKLVNIVAWIFFLGLIIWGSKKFFEDAGKIIHAIQTDTIKQLVPDEMVQLAMKGLNSIWKGLTGVDTPGYVELQNVINGVEKIQVDVKKDKSLEHDFKGSDKFDATKTNDMDAIKQNGGEKFANHLKEKVMSGEMTKYSQVHDAIQNLDPSNLPKGMNVAYVDGNISGILRKNILGNPDLLKQLGLNPTDFSMSNVSNEILMHNTKGMAGTVTQIMFNDNVPKSTVQKVLSLLGDQAHDAGKGFWSHILTGTATDTITTQTSTILPAIAGGFAPIVPMANVVKKKGGFMLRLGSSRSGNNVYTIPKGATTVAFKDTKKYQSLNEAGYAAMIKEVNNSYKTLRKLQDELANKKRTKEEKKQLDAINKSLRKMEEGAEEYECVVFYSDEVQEEQVKEGLFGGKSKKKEIKNKPVMMFNPIIMACIDLADRRKDKGPRKKPIYIKGLNASYEFLPIDKGMSEQEIIDMIVNLVQNGFRMAWNMTSDAPCIKQNGKYVENKDSQYQGKDRPDFGMFKNSEITEIFNNPGKVQDYMSGKFKKGSSTLENDPKKQEKALAKFKDDIENNNEVKELIKKSPSLKKHLIDDNGKVKEDELKKLGPLLFRMEANYSKKSQKKKGLFKGLLKKLKDAIFGVSDDYEPKEVRDLAYTLASIHNKRLKRKLKEKETNESFDEEYDMLLETILNVEINMKILKEEFLDYYYSNDDDNYDVYE